MRNESFSSRWSRRPGRSSTLLSAAILVVVLVVSMVSLALGASSFPDVATNHPYHDAIGHLAQRGIINGYTDGTFGPGNPVLRQQFAKMIVLSGDYPVSEADVNPFTDVENSGPDDLYPDNYVAVAAKHGITVGKTATTFDPYANIVRYQVITMVVRAADNLRPSLLAPPPAGYLGSAGWGGDPTHGANALRAEYNGLLVGLNLGALSPYGNMSRGEVAQVLHNLLVMMTPGTTTTLPPTTTTLPPTTTTTPPTTISTTTTLPPTTTSTTSTTSTTVVGAGWVNLGGDLTSSPAVASQGTYRLDVFVRGTDGALWHRPYSQFSGWGDWAKVGGFIRAGSNPTAVSWGFGRIDVFVVGSDDALWQISYNSGSWSQWNRLGGFVSTSPAAASRGVNRLDVFIRGSLGEIQQIYWNGSSWSTWQILGHLIDSGSAPTVATHGGNSIHVFYRGTDGALWYYPWFSAVGWGQISSLGGILTSSPAATFMDPNRRDVFVRATNGVLYQRSYTGFNWIPWQEVGGAPFVGDPAAVSWGANRIDVFVRGTNCNLWHKWWDGVTWRP
jgi:hypothetical protein